MCSKGQLNNLTILLIYYDIKYTLSVCHYCINALIIEYR